MKRLGTGIKQLDDCISGFLKDRTVLVTGDAGSGKTIFGLQFAYESCKAGLKAAYIATEENAEDLRQQATSFGWDIKTYEEKGMFTFIELAGPRVKDIESSMNIRIESAKGDFTQLLEAMPKDAQVMIVDSLGSHSSNLAPREFKDRLDLLVHELNERGITAMLILDSATSKEYNDLAMFSVYGAIELLKKENPYTGRRERVMDIIKMRNTKTPIQLLTMRITPKGIELVLKEGEKTS